MKGKLIVRRAQTHSRRRIWRKRVCVPVLCPVCRGRVCDCQLRPAQVTPLTVQLPYDLPY